MSTDLISCIGGPPSDVESRAPTMTTAIDAPPVRYDWRVHDQMPIHVSVDGVPHVLVFAYNIAAGRIWQIAREGMHIVFDEQDVALEEEVTGVVTVQWSLPQEHPDVQDAIARARDFGILA